jgi:hypothetical protein
MQASRKTGRRSAIIDRFAVLLLMTLSFNAILFSSFQKKQIKTGLVRLVFNNTVRSIPLILDTVTYKNIFAEPFTVTRFKYYVSNISLEKNGKAQKEEESYHLINARDSSSLSFSFPVAAGEYSSLNFLLGVDSLRNCSGAQTGALDPLNDMFWTWNSGYVMAKLEGESDSSKSMHRMEYHIGGYKAGNKVMQEIRLHPSSPILVSDGKETTIFIETDIAKWWQDIDKIHISEDPVCTTPGPLAKRISSNYSNMFGIQQVKH